MFGNLAQTIIALTDTAFLGRISEVALGASAMAGIYYYVFSTLAWGFALGVQVIIARRFGEKNYTRIGVVFEHGLLVVAMLGISLLTLLKFLSPEILRILITSDKVYETALLFIDYRAYGIFFVCINYLFRSLYIGVSNTNVISYTTALMAIVNVILNYLLVFGNFGFPELRVKGAAIASVIAELSATIFFFVFTYKTFPLKKYAMFVLHKFELPLLKAIFKIALPTMFQKLISFGTWLVFFSFVEKMGERPLASTMTVRSGYMMLGIPIYAFGATANTLISKLIGEGKLDHVVPTAWRILKLCFLTLIPMALFATIAPRMMLNIYTDNFDLISASINSIYVVVVSAFCLGYGMIFFEAISGTSNTHHGMYIEIFVLLTYIFTAWLTSSYLKLNVEYVWLSEVVYGAVLGFCSMIYMLKYNWRKHRRM